MTATISHFRLRSAEQRVGFLEAEADRGEAEGEELTAEVNRLHRELTQLDCRIQEAYFDGLPHSDDLSGTVAGLFRRWLALARKVDAAGGTDELRRNVRETAAMLDPSDELGGGMEALRDAALAEHAKSDRDASDGRFALIEQ